VMPQGFPEQMAYPFRQWALRWWMARRRGSKAASRAQCCLRGDLFEIRGSDPRLLWKRRCRDRR